MKIITAAEAASLIQDNWTVGIGSFGTYAVPEELIENVAERFRQEKHPAGITTVAGISPGSYKKGDYWGLSRLREEGLLKGVITSHIAAAPEIMEMIAENKIKGYAVPLGTLLELFRASAARRGGFVTKVGLDTFVDPRVEGMAMNQVSKDREFASAVNIGGEEMLMYKTFPMEACLIRGTVADENGNITMQEEAVGDCAYEMAAAVHNNGGIVIVQVRDIVPGGTIAPKDVMIHHSLVDYVVKCTDAQYHKQGYFYQYCPELDGSGRAENVEVEPLAMNNRKILARRAAMELTPGSKINLGIGIPSGVGTIANEEGFSDKVYLSLESGIIGGVPIEGPGFGAAVNPDVMYDMPKMFDQYDGGFLDAAFLGAAEIDSDGNVNVSSFENRRPGPGGFINISQNTKKIYFLGTFTGIGLKESIGDGKISILQEGKVRKFVNKVQQISFSGKYAVKTGQEVCYITERAVFSLTEKGIKLIEIAPGIDLQKDILDQMEFRPLIDEKLSTMDERIFYDKSMGFSLG